MNKYSYTITWSAEDDAYISRVAEFPSLAAHGESYEDALSEIQFVVKEVVKDLEASGEPVPEPLSERHYSGRMNLRMAPRLHQALVLEARQQGISVNKLINMKLLGSQ